LQLEYLYLAKASGNRIHFDRVSTVYFIGIVKRESALFQVNKVMKNFEKADLTKTGGMLPLAWDLVDGVPYDGKLPPRILYPLL
jgi:endoplasmic reticulum Man9GlcNAc2 1,2-alpha-mannosidase